MLLTFRAVAPGWKNRNSLVRKREATVRERAGARKYLETGIRNNKAGFGIKFSGRVRGIGNRTGRGVNYFSGTADKMERDGESNAAGPPRNRPISILEDHRPSGARPETILARGLSRLPNLINIHFNTFPLDSLFHQSKEFLFVLFLCMHNNI